jgi:hypothetical protein
MVNEPRYVRQKLQIALSMMKARSGPLGKRVRDAWEEMHVLDPEDFSNASIRADYEHLQSMRELYVVAPLVPNLTQSQLTEVSERIQRIHDAIVR